MELKATFMTNESVAVHVAGDSRNNQGGWGVSDSYAQKGMVGEALALA